LRASIDEEKRLFYVDITRAMSTLTLTYRQRRMRFGRVLYSNRSAFLNDLDPRFAEERDFYDRKGLAPVDPAGWLEAAVA
jgi:superfamily I DNA/RNA helicase